ncbi:MAG: hypothetical protein K2P19_04775, partial [Kineothrix sp.]|nr:hypothetical protein [Kineothrix sp.]
IYKLTEFDFSGAWDMLTAPTKSNIDEMVDSMQYAYYKIKKSGNDTLDSLIAKTYNLQDTGSDFVLSGNLNDIYEDLLGIQEMSKDFNVSDRFETGVIKAANAMNNTLNSYKEAYDIYILNKKILDDSENNQYDEQFNLINKAKETYDNAIISGNQDKIEETADEYAKTLQSAIDLAMGNYDYDVADYFKSMYPELQQMFGVWQFELNFEPNTDGLQDKVVTALDSIDGATDGITSFSVEDIENFNPNVATQEQIDAYGELNNIAESYGLTIKQLIILLQTMGLIQSERYQQLVDTFGQENVDKLSPKDLEIAYTIDNVGNMTFEQLQSEIQKIKDSTIENPISFSDALKQSEGIQSSISTLHSALDSFNQGTLDESAVLDLMQQFPELIPYIDLAAKGFGNLSEGLSTLIEQQPETLIQDLQTLKESLNTDEERAQVDALINSLQSLSSYGNTGMEAYATTVGSTWGDTANVIESVTNQFENLAKVQEAVADGLTMSATAAAELAKMYPEILTNAVDAGNGQITLNEEVVKGILAGDESIINAQITKLEADKAELEARKETAIAELEIANQVGTAKGQITEEEFRLRVEAMNQELENEISKNNQVGQSYAQTAESMASNMEQLGNYNAEVSDNMATNANAASASAADGMAINAEASQHSLSGIAQKATDVANAVLGIATGKTIQNQTAIYKGRGGTNKGGIKPVKSPGKFTSTVSDYLKGDLSLDGLKSGLEIDISSYEKAISNIDAQIDVLKNLQMTYDNNGGIGGHGYTDKIKDLEKEKDKLNSALDDAKGSSTEAKDEYEELFNFFERRVKVLD